MCSTLERALLAARMGTAPSRRSLDVVWAALTPHERAWLGRRAEELAEQRVRAVLSDAGEPLFYTGPYQAVGSRVLAVCGRREAGAGAVRLAELVARGAVAAGATVIAGDTEGPERAAVLAALEAGGLAVSVLAEGPGQAGGPRQVTVSPCAPGQPWSVNAAMACNAVIAGLCTALVAIGAGGTGATLDAGMRALAAGRPVLAVGATAGSRLLVDYGATAAVDEIELMWWLGRQLDRLCAADERLAPVTARAPSAAPPDRARSYGEAIRPPAGSRPEGRAAWHRPARRWSTV